MGERPLIVSPWYLPSDDEHESCTALEPANIESAPDTGDLCPDCASFDLSAALQDPKISLSHSILWLGPFDQPIEQTVCPLCQAARQALGHQDADPDVRIRIKTFDAAALSVSKVSRGKFIQGGYLSTGFFEINRPLDALAIQDEAATQPWRPSIRFLQPSLEWYTTYSESQAQQQCVEWLSKCSKHEHPMYDHPICASRSAAKSARQGHLINVFDMCIVQATSTAEAPYFALSYVCGGVETLELTTTNEANLSVHGSLSQQRLPRTYTDAFRLTKSLGVRYLWIDTLCILHDARGPRQDQIELMDRIYGDAHLVLVASVGTSPHFGLFPRSIEPRAIHGEYLHIDRRERVENEYSVISDYGSHDVLRTKYSTRMWCFQEQHLATRRVVFGAHWLVFDCCEAQWIAKIDDSGQMVPAPSVGSNSDAEAMRLLRQGASSSRTTFDGRQLDAYAQLAASYTESELSYAEDVERAFAGFAAVLSQGQTRTVAHNIPMAMLPHALLWDSYPQYSYRARSKQDVFPTWSWACTIDAIAYSGVSSLMFSSQSPPRTHLHQSLVRTFWLRPCSTTERFDVTSVIHKHAQAVMHTAATDRSETTELAAEQQPSEQRAVLQFTAYAVSPKRFWTKYLIPKAPRPEDWCGVAASQHLYMDDAAGVSTDAIGRVWGLAEGHRCISTADDPVADTRYSLVALLAVDSGRSKRPLPQEYFCIVVCDEGDVSRRVGMVSVNKEAFEKVGAESKAFRLV